MAQGVPQALQSQQQQPQPQPGVPFASTALYVGDLDPSVTEAQIHDIFNQIGHVVSVRICRDVVTRRSLGYGYVNYGSNQDASRAIEELNFMPVHGKPVRIMFSYRDPSIRKSGSGNLFVKNLDVGMDNKSLHELFAPFGKILSCKVALHEGTNASKGYGFVQFETEEAAHTATEKLNGTQFNGKQLFVGPFVRRQERDTGAAKFSNVFVKNLPDSTTDDELKELFEAFGPTTSAVVMRETNGKSKGFGFVNFSTAEDAAAAVEEMNGKLFQDKELYVSRAQKKTEREAELKAKFEHERKEEDKGSNLYLKNLDDSIDDEKLKALFSEFGTVTSSKVMRNPQGHSKGSGFVAFNSLDAAGRAVAQMNGRMLGQKPLYVAMAQKKEERKARLEAEFASRGPVTFTPPPPFQMGQQFMYSRSGPLMPPQQAGAFAYQQPMLGGMRPGMVQMHGYYPQRQNQVHGRVPPPQQQQQQQQFFQRGGPNFNRTAPPAGADGFAMTSPLASSLASATPEHQRIILGEHLYPMVDRLQHDHAGKITGMLLEMDQTEVLHLLESPEALKTKIGEAMEVLQEALISSDMSNLTVS